MIVMYRNDGLAEIVRDPSPKTLKYLTQWFTGEGAFGKGLSLLGWPVVKDNRPLLVWDKENGLRMDLAVEEKVMYSKTVFHYVKKDDDYVLAINLKSLLFPKKNLGTFKALWSQSKLLINYQKTYDNTKRLVEEIPITTPKDKEDLETTLASIVWPRVVAVDYTGEFLFSALSSNYAKDKKLELLNIIQDRNRDRDWYTQSVLAWSKYTEGKMSKEELAKDYGFAAGDEYEITQPRYYEIVKQPKPVVSELKIEEIQIKNLLDLVTGVQYLRSEAKRRSLIWIAALREVV